MQPYELTKQGRTQRETVGGIQVPIFLSKEVSYHSMMHHHHHHHVTLSAWISLTSPRHQSLSSIVSRRSSRLYISCIDTELLYIGSSWSSCLCSSQGDIIMNGLWSKIVRDDQKPSKSSLLLVEVYWQIFFVFTIFSFGPAVSVRQWPGRPGFNPRSSHTKDFKNGTWYHLA